MTIFMPNMPNSKRVALIAYEGAQMSAVLGLVDFFDMANRMADQITGFVITYEILETPPVENNVIYDAIILPPNLVGARGTADHALCKWIAHQHQLGSMACSACAGAFWLGYAGILNGRPATTHWALEDEFKISFPKVHLHPEHILLDDYDIVTAGGVMAWTELAVHLVRLWLGAGVVSRTCRQLLIDPTGREQRNYRSFRPNLTHQNLVIRNLQLWMESHVNNDLSVAILAKQANISTRSLQRQFTNVTGFTLSQYIQELRIEKAKGLLELTALSISEICWEVGYQDVSAFSRLFKSNTGISARHYRRRFKIV